MQDLEWAAVHSAAGTEEQKGDRERGQGRRKEPNKDRRGEKSPHKTTAQVMHDKPIVRVRKGERQTTGRVPVGMKSRKTERDKQETAGQGRATTPQHEEHSGKCRAPQRRAAKDRRPVDGRKVPRGGPGRGQGRGHSDRKGQTGGQRGMAA